MHILEKREWKRPKIRKRFFGDVYQENFRKIVYNLSNVTISSSLTCFVERAGGIFYKSFIISLIILWWNLVKLSIIWFWMWGFAYFPCAKDLYSIILFLILSTFFYIKSFIISYHIYYYYYYIYYIFYIYHIISYISYHIFILSMGS